MATKITNSHSPDSDDAFMFYGFASGAVDTEGLESRRSWPTSNR